MMSEPHERAMKLALNITTAVHAKLKLKDRYNTSVRRQVCGPVAWIEICMNKVGMMPDKGETSSAHQESRFLVETLDEKNALATEIFRVFKMVYGIE